jgi:hypothetical protein
MSVRNICEVYIILILFLFHFLKYMLEGDYLNVNLAVVR